MQIIAELGIWQPCPVFSSLLSIIYLETTGRRGYKERFEDGIL